MSKKPRKVGESAASYSTKKPRAKALASQPTTPTPAPAPRTVDQATFKKVTDKIFSERRELLRKLAQ